MMQARTSQSIVGGLVLLLITAGAAWGQPASAPATPVDPVEQWIQDTKHPVSWLTWGADQRLRFEHYTNPLLDESSATRERSYGRHRTRVWATVTPFPDFEINGRMAWEFRHYCQPDVQNYRDVNMDEVLWDILNIKWKNIGGLPLTATIGRQEIILGNGWLVLDGTPLDGSRTISFDAVRLTYDLKDIQTTVDAIFIGQKAREDMYIEPYNHDHVGRLFTEQDELGAIAYVTNKSIKGTELNGYYIFKHDEKESPTGENGQVHAIGARVVHDFADNWQIRAEFAEEVGEKGGHSLCATGINTQLTYFFRDALQNYLHTGYEYLSGDRSGTGTNEGFDPLWGRWPQWSELAATVWALDTGRPAFWTNYHRVNFGHGFSPHPKLQICTDYNLVFADQNYDDRAGFSENGCFRGQHGSIIAKYKHNQHLSSHVYFEIFGPGDFYTDDRNDTAVFARYELMLTW